MSIVRQQNTYRAERKKLIKTLKGNWKLVPYQRYYDKANQNKEPDQRAGFAIKFILQF